MFGVQCSGIRSRPEIGCHLAGEGVGQSAWANRDVGMANVANGDVANGDVLCKMLLQRSLQPYCHKSPAAARFAALVGAGTLDVLTEWVYVVCGGVTVAPGSCRAKKKHSAQNVLVLTT